ncbi:hypothetical protein Tco_1283041 [Tanacetum coccineum]
MTHLPLHSSKETHLLMEFALKHGQKKHKGPNDWIASVAIRVLHFDPRAINQHPIIRRNQRIRSKAGRSHAKLDDIQELLHQLLNDLQIISEELSEFVNCPRVGIRTTFMTMIDNDSFENIDYVEASPPEDSLIMGNEELSTIPEKESDEFIKSSVEDLVPIPSESKGTSVNDSESVSPSSDDFSPISIFEEKSVTYSNPLFDSNDDFTSSDDESLSDEDVPEDNVKIYSNPLFEFNDGYISSDVNPLFDEVLEDIKFKDSYDSNLDESTFLVTPLSDSNKDECFTPCDDVELLLHHDPSISIVSILEGFTNEPPLEENDDLLMILFLSMSGEVRLMFLRILKMMIPSHLSFGLFSRFSPTLWILLYFSLLGVKTPFLTPASPLRAGGILSGWNFHDCPDFEDSRVHGFVHSYIRASYPQLHLGNPIS